jgi:SAM-dependent methyltransferase
MNLTPPPLSFDSHADAYEEDCSRGLALSGENKEFFARGRLRCLEEFRVRRGVAVPSRVIDFGCGIGDITHLLAERYPQATLLGVDASLRCIERARSRYASSRATFAGLEALDAADSPADLVHVNGVVHHVPAAARARLFSTLFSLLRPGGILALFENNPLNPGTRLVMSRIPFDRDAEPIVSWSVRRLAHAAGFECLQTSHLFFFPRFLAYLRPLEKRLTRFPLGAQYVVFARRPSR